jgi:hypothetical protein
MSDKKAWIVWSQPFDHNQFLTLNTLSRKIWPAWEDSNMISAFQPSDLLYSLGDFFEYIYTCLLRLSKHSLTKVTVYKGRSYQGKKTDLIIKACIQCWIYRERVLHCIERFYSNPLIQKSFKEIPVKWGNTHCKCNFSNAIVFNMLRTSHLTCPDQSIILKWATQRSNVKMVKSEI